MGMRCPRCDRRVEGSGCREHGALEDGSLRAPVPVIGGITVLADLHPAVAVAEIDLSKRFRQDWIGDWNDSYQRQQRPAAYRR